MSQEEREENDPLLLCTKPGPSVPEQVLVSFAEIKNRWMLQPRGKQNQSVVRHVFVPRLHVTPKRREKENLLGQTVTGVGINNHQHISEGSRRGRARGFEGEDSWADRGGGSGGEEMNPVGSSPRVEPGVTMADLWVPADWNQKRLFYSGRQRAGPEQRSSWRGKRRVFSRRHQVSGQKSRG